ncbi:hypothetical protein RBWH47_00042 [Rhodopirellula baltica WH47]|uniref:Uncharacterized protein n=1 Tax=Rhodopirellula baltica WH47 TaxID=991778 RepID=F2B154_RHOBT|nr:hypothetical protein RBWH47_00042 [Rhodopirellula baltica WH47]
MDPTSRDAKCFARVSEFAPKLVGAPNDCNGGLDGIHEAKLLLIP